MIEVLRARGKGSKERVVPFGGPAAAALVRQYASADIRHVHREAEGLGHFGFFRKRFAESLWPQVRQWLGRHAGSAA